MRSHFLPAGVGVVAQVIAVDSDGRLARATRARPARLHLSCGRHRQTRLMLLIRDEEGALPAPVLRTM